MVSFQQGEMAAFDKVYTMYWPGLQYFANRLIDDSPEAEDIVNEIFIKLWKMRSDFNTMANVKAFLYIATRNACLNFIKFRKRKKQYTKELNSQWVQSDELQFDLVRETEINSFLVNELNNLRGNIKLVMQLAYYENLANKEIAERLNISIHSVETCKARGIQKLRESLKRYRLHKELDSWFLILVILYWILFYLFKWYSGSL